MAKANQTEMKKRILAVYTMLCNGGSYSDVVRYVREKYDIHTNRMAEVYMQKAMEIINEDFKEDITHVRKIANARLNTIFKMQVRDKKLRDAVYTQAQINKINGLESVDLNHNGNIDINNKIEFSIIGVSNESAPDTE
jgi:hypothetical protein